MAIIEVRDFAQCVIFDLGGTRRPPIYSNNIRGVLNEVWCGKIMYTTCVYRVDAYSHCHGFNDNEKETRRAIARNIIAQSHTHSSSRVVYFIHQHYKCMLEKKNEGT